MTKLYASLLSLTLFLAMYADAQNTVQIGTGTDVPANTLYSPVYRFSATSTTNGSRSNILFTAAEMAAAGIPNGATITKVEFNKTNAASFLVPATHQMLMANTSNTTLATTTTWASIQTTHTQVFSSSSFNVPSTPGWVAWNITPFTYTGGALEIATETSMTGNGGTDGPFQWEYTTGFQDKIVGVASATGATLNGTVAAYKHRPNIRITYSSGGCTNPATPGQATSSAVAAGVCPGTAVTLGLTGNSSGSGQTYKWQSSAALAGPYTDISTESTSPSLSVSPTVTTFYRAIVKCGASGSPQMSVAVQVVVNPALPAGTYTIDNTQPTGGTNFQSFSDAISRMNCGVAGPVFFNVAAGQVFTESPEISLQGTASNSITFRKNGSGANPKIAKSGTSATGEYLLKLTGADYITFDGIDLEQTGTSSADWVEYGIFISNASATNGAQNNTFKNGTISLSGSATASRCVFMDQVTTPTSTTGTNSNNKFLNMTVQNAFNGYYLTGSTTAYPDDGTEINTQPGGTSRIQNLGDGTVSGSMYGIYASYQTAFKLRNTQITNLQNGGTGLIYATYFLTASNNSVEVSGNAYSNVVGGGVVTALYMTAGSSLSVFNNQFSAIRSTTVTSSAVRAIDVTATGLTAVIHSNVISDVTSTGLTGTTVGAIELATGLNYTVYNNMISGLRAPGSTSTAGSVKGIAVVGGSTGGVVRLYYNTIYLTDVGAAANYTSAGIYNSSTTPTLDMQNNVVVNRTDVSTGTRAVAFWKTSASLNLDAATDNNLYYAGTPGSKNLIYYDGTSSAQQLNDYKLLTGLSPRESSSVTENVAFLAPVAGVLRIDPAAASLAESGGKEIAGITLDFEGNQRGPYPLGGQSNGGGLKPDIGADEYDGHPIDAIGPDINFTPLVNTASAANRTLTVTITDISRVAVGAAGPRLYYRKSGAATYAFDASPVVSGDQYTFTLNSASLGSLTGGDVIDYYIAAQDNNGNTSTLPFGGSGANPPGTTPPPTPATYRILNALNGVYTVGASGTYQNLTAIANLLNNSAELTGHTVFELRADYDGTTGETFPIQFNPLLTNNPAWTVTIRPAAGVTGRTTAGDPGTSNPLINLSGADRITFDGRPGGVGTSAEWTLRNTRTATTIGSVFRFINEATYDTLRYLNMESEATSTVQGLVVFSTSASGTLGNSYHTVANNRLSGRTDAPSVMSNGIYSLGTLAAPNTNITLRANHIVNFVNYGIYVSATGNGANWVLDANHIYADSVTSATKYGIYFAADSSKNALITNNFIGGSGPNAAGLMTITGNVTVAGINVVDGLASITGNTVANIVNTNTGSAARIRGIAVSSVVAGAASVSNNTVYNLSTAGAGVGVAFGTQPAAGILIAPSGVFVNYAVNGNTVYNIAIENTSPLTSTNIAAGLALYNLQNTTVMANRVYGITNKTTGITVNQPPVAVGIFNSFLTNTTTANNMVSLGFGEAGNTQYIGIMQLGRGTGNVHNYYFNSVAIGGSSTGDFNSYGFVRGLDTTTEQHQIANLRNNVFQISRTGQAVGYPIANRGTMPAGGWSSNYNAFYNPNLGTIGYWNASAYGLSGWQTASGGDANSRILAVNFVNNATADLHLAGSSVGNQLLAGTPVAPVTVDFDNQVRNATRPYIGADEVLGDGASLPVRLEYFKGTRQGGVHILAWKGLCSGDDNRFAIERSNDGRTFAGIGEVKASLAACGSALGFTDRAPLPGINYYRLKITDDRGQQTHSFVIALINRESGFEVVSVLPTLTQGNVWVSVSSTRSTSLRLSVVDGQGRLVRKMENAVPQGSSLVLLETQGLPAGIFTVWATGPDGYERSFRFVKR